MDQEEWELEVDRDIGEWLSQSDRNLATELDDFIVDKGWENQGKISEGPGREGDREVATIILATAALVKALNPILIALIRERFPNGRVTEHRRPGGKHVLRVTKGE